MNFARTEAGLLLAAASLCCLSLSACGIKSSQQGSQPSASGTPAVSATEAPAKSGPDLASCKPAEGRGEGGLQRKTALPVPKALAGIVASDLDHLAVATLGGGTVCVDTQWIENTDGIKLSKDGRFVSFGWNGYEEYGYKLIDRSDGGEVVETGVKPIPSPSGRRIASLEYSESGFGSLNALGIWQVTDEPVRQLAVVDFADGFTDWRFEGWRGDDCIAASAISMVQLGQDEFEASTSVRSHYLSSKSSGWQLEPAGKAGCAAP